MKREIKFRYWNGLTNQMVHEPEMPFKEGWTITQLFSERGWHWLQFTGLTDKNGKEIYEGDIVRNGDVAEVFGFELESGFAIKVNTWIYSHYFNEAFGVKNGQVNCEIIGNIYENPELLKQQAN